MTSIQRRTLLFIIGNKTDAAGIRSYIDHLITEFTCVIYFTSSRFHDESASMFSDCEILKYEYHHPRFTPSRWGYERSGRRLGRKHWLTLFLSERVEEHKRKAFRKWCKQTVESLGEAVIVSPSDRRMGEDAVLIFTAKLRGLHFVTLLVAAPADEDILIPTKAGNPRYQESGDLKSVFPLHFRVTPKGSVSFFLRRQYDYFLNHLKRRELRNPMLRQTNPWSIGEMWADAVIVSSEKTASLLESGGTQRKKIEVLGSAALDNLARSHADTEAARRRMGVGSGETLLGWAVHQHFEQNRCTLERSLSIADEVASALAATGFAVRCSLHPKMPNGRYSAVLQRPQFKVQTEKLETWLPAVDLVVISAFSSTAYWALACGIPTIMYDFLDREAHPMERLPGIRFVRRSEELKDALRIAAEGGDEWNAWSVAAKHASSAYGERDGTSMARIKDKLSALAKERSGSRPFSWRKPPLRGTKDATL
jgi:hypothetical protein